VSAQFLLSVKNKKPNFCKQSFLILGLKSKSVNSVNSMSYFIPRPLFICYWFRKKVIRLKQITTHTKESFRKYVCFQTSRRFLLITVCECVSRMDSNYFNLKHNKSSLRRQIKVVKFRPRLSPFEFSAEIWMDAWPRLDEYKVQSPSRWWEEFITQEGELKSFIISQLLMHAKTWKLCCWWLLISTDWRDKLERRFKTSFNIISCWLRKV